MEARGGGRHHREAFWGAKYLLSIVFLSPRISVKMTKIAFAAGALPRPRITSLHSSTFAILLPRWSPKILATSLPNN